MNPWKLLLQSRKFCLLLLDTVIALVTYFVGKYVPAAIDDLKYLVLVLQPVFVTIIIAIAYEDVNKAQLPPVQ